MLDAEGKPIAVYPCHAKHAPGQYVGAQAIVEVVSPAETIQVKRKDRRGQTSVETVQSKAERSRVTFAFESEPVDVPADGAVGAYYRAGVRAGALIAADAATARACGVQFVPVADALTIARERAASEFARESGEAPPWAIAENQTAPVVAPK